MSTPGEILDATTKSVSDKATTTGTAAQGILSTVDKKNAQAAIMAAALPGVVSAAAKIPITIFIVSQHHSQSVFFEKAFEEIGRMHNSGVSMRFALERPHDQDMYKDVASYFKAKFNGKQEIEQMIEKMLEFCCSIGPTVTREQIEEFFKNSKYAKTAKENSAHINFLFNTVIKRQDQYEVPELSISEMYDELKYYRMFCVLRYLQSRKLSCVGIDIDCNPIHTASKHLRTELAASLEDTRMAGMTKRLGVMVKNMPNTGGVIWALNFGSLHLHRLGAWMLRESRRDPELQKYDIQLKLIYGKTNRQILMKAGYNADSSVHFKKALDEGINRDSQEIRDLYSEIPCHTLMFEKKDNGTFGVTCPEFNKMVTEAITRHKLKPKLDLETTSLSGSGRGAATAAASAAGSGSKATGSKAAAASAPAKTDGSSPVLLYSKDGTLVGTASLPLKDSIEGIANASTITSAIKMTEDMNASKKPKILSHKKLSDV